MIHRKQHKTSRLSARLTLGSFVFAIAISGTYMFTTRTQQAYADTSSPSICSNVFAALPTWLTTDVAANESTYVQAMGATGVPWQMLAAIHYRETNLSLAEPSNGAGLYQDGYAVASAGTTLNSSQFYQETLKAAQLLQSTYALENSPNAASNVTPTELTSNDQNINEIKNTFYSWNGRAGVYASQAATYGYSSTAAPYEGSPYVMNMFDCPRASMGIITQDGGGIAGQDTRYGAFTLYARLISNSYWLAMTQPYSWVVTSQGLYNDPSNTNPTNTSLMAPNTTYYAVVNVVNIGSSTWSNSGANPVDMGTSNPDDRMSAFCNNTWLSCNRPARLMQSSVGPGQSGTFEFTITTPSTYGTYDEYFNLVDEGVSWMDDIGMYWQFTIAPPVQRWQLGAEQLYTDSGYTLPANPAALSPNTTYYVRVQALNIGNTTWSNSGSGAINLATAAPYNRNSAFCNTSWLTCDRPAALQQATVSPGQFGTYLFTITTPSTLGLYNERFNLVQEGVTYLPDIGMYLPLNVTSPIALWQYDGQATYTDNTMSTPIDTTQLDNGTRFYMVVYALNTGNTTWTNSGANPVDLGTSESQDRTSAFCDPTWISCNRPARLTQASVAPGQVGTFQFWMQSPDTANGTSYQEHFTPVVEGSMWMDDVGMYQSITMQSPITNWQYQGQSAFSSSNYTNPVNLSAAQPSTTYYLQLQLKNTSGVTWYNSGANPLDLGTSNPQGHAASNVCNNTWLIATPGCNRAARLQQASVAPGQTGTINFSITTPSAPLTNDQEYFEPVLEGESWLTDIGLYWSITT